MNQTNSIVVIKVGGDVIADDQSLANLVKTISILIKAGHRIVIVHGGGPQINQLQTQCGLTPQKIAGRRITTRADLDIVTKAMCGDANTKLTTAMALAKIPALGCHGASLGLIKAQKRPAKVLQGSDNKPIDLGRVGDITDVNTTAIHNMLQHDWIPVIATLGIDTEAEAPNDALYNINADTTVIAVASQLKADLLLMVTEIGAVFKDINDINSRISHINRHTANSLIKDGTINGGMIAKIEEALSAVAKGVGQVIVLGPNQSETNLRKLGTAEKNLPMGTVISEN